jgi:hypothetical protein
MMFSNNGGEATAQEKLKELKQQNAKRWEKLKLLHAAAMGGNEEETTTPANDDEPSSTNTSTGNEDLDDGNPRAFLREVVETHDELVQTKAVLEQRLQHDKRKLDEMKFLLQQNRELRAGLDDKKEEARSKRNDGDDSKESRIETRRNKLQQEHEWLLEELSYVANLIHDNDDCPPQLWSLEKLLRELLNSVWDDNGWVYTTSKNPIHPKHLALLQKYHVIQSHGLEENLVRLTDYLAGV